jgi:hypothetical protein
MVRNQDPGEMPVFLAVNNFRWHFEESRHSRNKTSEKQSLPTECPLG